MTTGPHEFRDPNQPNPPAPSGRTPDAPGGRSPRRAPGEGGVFTSVAGNVGMILLLAACGAGTLAILGRTTGAYSILAVNALVLLGYLVYRRSFDRIEASATEGLLSWLLWTLLMGTATVFYAFDWRIMGASVLALLLVISLGNLYLVVMRPDVVDDMVRRSRERDDDDPLE